MIDLERIRADITLHEAEGRDMTVRKVLVAEIEQMRAALESIEWIADYDGVLWCPSCRGVHPEHASTCQLRAALDKVQP